MLSRDIVPAGLILVQFVGMPEIPGYEDDDEHNQHYADDQNGGAPETAGRGSLRIVHHMLPFLICSL